ncbi:protein FAR1-RELATED SEQUENCE 6-like [Hordeum vulgare subsp. vulgare]|uniref:protein FAR1-RELATED SEQUENCE 6-like n=1 Tax=Hordeum vulgare subsp. vulgare TaxID=112509 RepID=UPI001D1A57B3|nr:protein FAR1-RELATED SEQUENCE 6-like [Hordeum vulgare subsp. vulgare]
MHLFVRQYEKMQFDRDSEESYQEKRTKLGGVVLAQNLPIEIHASQIYTRAMFEKFGEMLYECGSYVLTEVVARCEYIAVHVKKASRDKWSKNQFLVRVSEPVDEFNCECGMFQHFGMVCSHALKVMVHLGLQEVPAKHVLKRWTKDARDILPQEFLRYQKDQGPLKYSSRRHNNLHLLCLEIVRLGDSNVDSYDIAMEHLRNVKTLLEPVAAIRDGMGLSDREGAGDSTCSGTVQQQHFGAAHQVHSSTQCSDSFGAPSKKRPAGRPTTSRDKAPYEKPTKRTRFCSICGGQGHKNTTCPQRGDLPKAPRKSPRCSRCGLIGHRRNTCTNTPRADFYG